MLRAGLKSLLARKLRLLLSGFAIVLGVAFVAGSFVFTDTLAASFTGITSGSVGDVVVRPQTDPQAGSRSRSAARLPGSLVTRLADTPGAARADGQVFNAGTFVVGRDRKLVSSGGAPGIAINYTGGPAANGAEGARLESGRWPRRTGEVVLDPRTAETAGYRLGDRVLLVSGGTTPRIVAKLVGTATFGGGSLAGATLSIFDTRTAQTYFMDGKNEFASVWVTAERGTSQEDLRAAVARELPAGVEAVTGDKAADEAASSIQRALGFINTFLLVFAGVALVVGTFLIVNTFSILVAQRSRELALFRAMGASRAQVARSVLLEALVTALAASAAGLGLGLVLAAGIKALFARFGLDLSTTELVFRPRTAVIAFAVGILVTLVAAYLPARRAGSVPPVAAMRDDVVVAESGMRRRVLAGVVLTVVGAGALAVGLFTDVDDTTYWVGAGILAVVLGVAALSPILGRPVIATLGAAYRRLFGAVGRMAEQNAQRNPRRTGATASALMIGVTLVSMMAVVGASAKESVDVAIAKQFAADYVVSNAIGQGFSPTITDEVAAVPGVATVARVRYSPLQIKGQRVFAGAADPTTLPRVQPPTMVSGRLADLDRSGILLETERARELGVSVGDTVPVGSGTARAQLRVVGIFERSDLLGTSALLSLDGFTRLQVEPQDTFAYVLRAPGARPADVKAGIERTLADLPLVSVKDQDEFAAEQREPIDRLLLIIYALLGLAVVIAILGIVNTLSLSVIERTREVGLLRAVGLSRRQLRTMLRLESVAIAMLGATLGVVLGVAFGVALQRSLVSEGITELAVPVAQLLAFVAISALVGVLAAVWPGRRAARLDVLRAITTE